MKDDFKSMVVSDKTVACSCPVRFFIVAMGNNGSLYHLASNVT